jgi:hypothetical protein
MVELKVTMTCFKFVDVLLNLLLVMMVYQRKALGARHMETLLFGDGATELGIQ